MTKPRRPRKSKFDDTKWRCLDTRVEVEHRIGQFSYSSNVLSFDRIKQLHAWLGRVIDYLEAREK